MEKQTTSNMRRKLSSLFILCFIILLSSCGGSKKETAKDKTNQTIHDLAIKYNAVSDWDSTSLYTCHFQEMFIEDNKLMVLKGRIYDIEKKDSSYVVKVLDEREDVSKNYLALITFTPQQFNVIYSGNKSTRGVFVIQVSKVTSSNPSIREDEASNGDDGTYTYTHLSDEDDQMITIFRGKLIDFRLEEIEENK